MRSRRAAVLLGAVLLWLWPGSGVEAQTPHYKIAAAPIATGARLHGDISRTRFVADLTRAVSFNVYVLDNPYRVIVELPEIDFQLPSGLGKSGHGLVSAYRYGRFEAGKSRIVLDAKAPVLIEKSFSIKAANGQPARLVLDLVRTDVRTFSAKKRKSGPPPTALPRPRLKPKPVRRAALPKPRAKPLASLALRPAIARKPVIVIDPGHGGVDPGAISGRGTTEKRVVFAFSKILFRELAKTGRYKVLMTRSTDTFMRLRARVDVARRAQADLFIAVHADSLRIGEAHGATVYTLSEKASDRAAAELAARENRADLIAGVNLAEESDEVKAALIDLAQHETKKHSVYFARTLIKSLKQVTSLAGNPHRFAGFKVLKAPDVPSILLELGYLTSRADEKRLLSAAWRSSTALAVSKAVAKYFAARLARN
jgi:N-acetylmuramoyl-L-alanine amidase